MYACSIPTEDGSLSIITNECAVLASGWVQDYSELTALIHPSLRSPIIEDSPPILDEAVKAIEKYYSGDYSSTLDIPVLQMSGPFRVRAWAALRQVPAGELRSYYFLAQQAGNPRAARAAASACAMNAAALFVPCHRIQRSDGGPGGFRYGLAIKYSLIARESGKYMGS